jgi:hypothetical protein
VIISDINRFVFVHNPKCAGTSIRFALSKIDSYNNFFSGCGVIDNKKFAKMHLPLRLLSSFFPVEFEKIKKYFSFVVVRNPYTRFLSAYKRVFVSEFYQYKETNDIGAFISKFNNFVEFFDDEKIDNYDYEFRHFTKQKEYVYYNNECMIDKVYKYEVLERELCDLEWLMPAAHQYLRNLKYLNARHMHHALNEIINQDSKKKIYQIYKEDFLLFNYSSDF